jgi:hypothetical protein
MLTLAPLHEAIGNLPETGKKSYSADCIATPFMPAAPNRPNGDPFNALHILDDVDGSPFAETFDQG